MGKRITEKQIELIFKGYEAGFTLVQDVCHFAGVSREWYYEKMQEPEFAAKVEVSKTGRKLRALLVIRKAAETNWQAAAWYLERVFPEDYAIHHKTELTGKGGRPLIPREKEDSTLNNLEKLSAADLQALAKSVKLALTPIDPTITNGNGHFNP